MKFLKIILAMGIIALDCLVIAAIIATNGLIFLFALSIYRFHRNKYSIRQHCKQADLCDEEDA